MGSHTIDYTKRPEMMMTSRAASELYFAALELKEALEPVVLSGEIGDFPNAVEIERSYYRISAALDSYQGRAPDASHD